jgi:lipoate-protein ligase A
VSLSDDGSGHGPGGAWRVVHRRGSAAELHALDLPGPAPVGRELWVLEATAPAVVLGSAQRRLAGGGEATPVRSSGGGAVLVDPDRCLWVDVVIGRDDPLWHDDVGRSGLWLGRCWQVALATFDVAGDVHEGPADRDELARAACFAGVGPGEVVAAGRKLVGISQRRTRSGARFQCIAYTGRPDSAPVVTALGTQAPPGLDAVLAARVGHVTVGPSVLADALVRAMMSASPVVDGPAPDAAPSSSTVGS